MAQSKNIKVTESSFEMALGKLSTLHSNLVSTKTNFESICSDLLEDWDGEASKQGESVLKDIKSKFQTCVDDFEAIRKDMAISLDDFVNSDKAIAQGIDEKTVINHKK